MTILTKEQRDALAKKLDDLIKLPTWAEPFDRIVLNSGVILHIILSLWL